MHWRSRGIVWSAAIVAVAVVGFISTNVSAQGGLPVVPGAAGFGMDTRAAYGCGSNPAIIRVTNTSDSGRGSLREAIDTYAPRVVIFETSGTIDLASDLDVVAPCLTIAGQTAPSPGITLRNGGINVYAHDVLVQHLRIRPGDGGPVLPPTQAHNGLLVYQAFGFQPRNVVFDHLSVSWAGGKNILLMPGVGSVTVWRSIISEALHYSANVIVSGGELSSLGMLVAGLSESGDPANVSIMQSLFAHNSARNPEIGGMSDLHFINNVVYDWGTDSSNPYNWATLFYVPAAGWWRASVLGNKYIAGPGSSASAPLYAIGTWSGGFSSRIRLDDNAVDETHSRVATYYNFLPFDPRVGDSPVPLDGVPVHSSSGVESLVFGNAGARPADRDAVDHRIVQQVAARSGGRISSQNEVGGWPDLPVNQRALSEPSNPHGVTSSGYTNLEVWLHQHAAAVEDGAPSESRLPSPPRNLRMSQAAGE